MAVIHGSGASVALASGASTTFTNEATTANAARTIYSITDQAKRYWDDTATLTVQKSTDAGATWTAATGYTAQYPGGAITFTSAQAVGTLVRVSGKYLTTTTIGQAYEWSLDLALDTTDTSAFGDTWRAFTPSQRGASASLTAWWLDDAALTLLTNGGRCAVALHTGTGRYEGFARLTSDAVAAAVGSAVGDDLAFTYDGQVYYTAG